jgi:dipeptidyl aminopeptidase/acylaminoacyl peptidase
VEAEQVVESLKKRNVPVKYVLFPDEGHGWRKTKNRVTSTVEIVAIVQKGGTPVWYLEGKDEGHGFNKKRNQDYQMYATILFMQTYLLDGLAPAPAR